MEKQFGFVSCDNGRQDLFTHAEYIVDSQDKSDAKTKGLRRGDRIAFEVEEPKSGKKSQQAVNVEILEMESDLVAPAEDVAAAGAGAAEGAPRDEGAPADDETRLHRSLQRYELGTGSVQSVVTGILQGTKCAESVVRHRHRSRTSASKGRTEVEAAGEAHLLAAHLATAVHLPATTARPLAAAALLRATAAPHLVAVALLLVAAVHLLAAAAPCVVG
eukprot:CAMPEP_0197672236 /NCGR_PEP_ID=MMETSP1338-20131121/78471_1 /TAXON_ID=43686 ORGANISM="Pelagodinium beii, Strain RCC1491" /NCGR_SAMPLE_ID=MMETSP1338 /ASSEMBLY_ACC=CAM_ASM_000754 /LENGTH=217 /DNA_ID=CAMNT_0043252293 /DNA_START=68 /DNA_END=718 /DNA_ORIENTATION=+